MKYLKKFKNYGLSLTITQLMGLLVMCNIASCSKCSPDMPNSPDTPNKSGLIVQVNQEHIQSQGKIAIIFRNSRDAVIKLKNYTLKATISDAKETPDDEEETLDNKIIYTDKNGIKNRVLSIDAPLTDFIAANCTELAKKDTQTINLGLECGRYTRLLTIVLEIFETGNEKAIHTATIPWSQEPGKLLIVDHSSLGLGLNGHFCVQASNGDVDPTTVQVKWKCSDESTYQIGGQDPGAEITLADMLGDPAIIQEGHKAGPIQAKLTVKQSTIPFLDIQLLNKVGQTIGHKVFT